MKWLATLLFILLLAEVATAQKLGFDKRLADSLGADKYGMKMYVLAMLKKGTATVGEIP